MKIALPHQNGMIYMNFGRTGQFIVYDVDEETKQILSSKIVFTHGQNAKGLAALLAEEEVELLLCNIAGKNGKAALDEECIEVVEGLDGSTEETVNNYLKIGLV